MSKRQIGSFASLFVLALILLLTGINIFPSVFRYSSKAHHLGVACAGNLKNIGLGLRMYAGDHDEIYPGKLVDAGRYLAYQPAVFICPSSGTSTGSFGTVDEWTDYVYVKGLAESAPPNTVLMYCSAENHGGEGGNVLFTDGHVEWFDSKRTEGDGETIRSLSDVIGTANKGGR